MSKRYSVETLAPIITETLNGNGSVSFVLGGTSMLPAIRDGIDTVTLVKPHKLKKGDVIFYQQKRKMWSGIWQKVAGFTLIFQL